MLTQRSTLSLLPLAILAACYSNDGGALEEAASSGDALAETSASEADSQLEEVDEGLLSDDPRIASMVADEGVSVAEAKRRIVVQDRAQPIVDVLAEELGDDFGGMWFDDTSGRLKVGVVAQQTASLPFARDITAIRSAAVENDTDVVSVRWSLAELDRVAGALADPLAAANEGASSRVGLVVRTDTNHVSLEIPEAPLTPEQSRFIQEAQETYQGRIYLEQVEGDNILVNDVCTRNACNPPLRAGLAIDSNEGGFCTLGFLARAKSDPRWFALTAGHCADAFFAFEPGPAIWRARFEDGSKHTIGRTVKFVDGKNGDSALITIDNVAGWNPRPWVIVHGSPTTTYDPRYAIKSTGTSYVGMRACKTGKTTGTTCGKVTGLNSFGEGWVRASYCAEGGDSGGPVYSGGKAYGLHKGSTSSCVTYFDPIARVLNNMTVKLAT